MSASFAEQSPLHVAIEPDGHGSWALAHGLPRSDGHGAGVDALRRVVRAAPDLGVGVLTIQALGCDDERSSEPERLAMLACIRALLELETPAFVRSGVRVTVLGCRERLPAEVGRAIEETERATAQGTRLHLRLALDYSARRAILAAFLGAIVGPPGQPACFGPDVDFLICTGGERRLRDFMLWECANAELVFADAPWPEFGERELAAAVSEFRRRRVAASSLAIARDSTAPDSCAAPAFP